MGADGWGGLGRAEEVREVRSGELCRGGEVVINRGVFETSRRGDWGCSVMSLYMIRYDRRAPYPCHPTTR